ncbi:MAG TPA: tetratricopeptide repeat protein [Thermoanaerobaculia bacterium]|nr:tetratricopeptide repeat protein [Thermoanaerobaculia bacterium]
MSGRRLLWVVAPLLAALVWWSSERAYDRLRASVVLQGAESQGARIAAQWSRLGPQARPLVTAHLQALRAVRELAPADARVPLAIGSHYLLLENATSATEWYRRALAVEPRAEIYLNLGRAALLAGDRPAALEHFRTAIRLDRSFRRSLPPDVAEELATEASSGR